MRCQRWSITGCGVIELWNECCPGSRVEFVVTWIDASRWISRIFGYNLRVAEAPGHVRHVGVNGSRAAISAGYTSSARPLTEIPEFGVEKVRSRVRRNGRWSGSILLVSLVAAGLLLFSVSPAFAHCDGLDGPVVAAARVALQTGNINHL
jgi:hypothetical protein